MTFADPARALPPPALERLRHWQGQMLRGRDFRDQLAFDAELRHWHNRALHSSGVREGLGVGLLLLDRRLVVRVQPGLAYDCFGRALVLDESRDVEIPGWASRERVSALLLIRHATGTGEAGLAPAELVWEPESCIEPSHGVPLARMVWEFGPPSLDDELRRPSRPLARPRFGHGATVPGATPWAAWDVESQWWMGLQVRVDTSAAGFTDVPCYFAWLQARDWSGGDDSRRVRYVILSRHLAEESPVDFRFRFITRLRGQDRVAEQNALLNYATRAGLFVCWAGLEHGPVSTSPASARRRCCP